MGPIHSASAASRLRFPIVLYGHPWRATLRTKLREFMCHTPRHRPGHWKFDVRPPTAELRRNRYKERRRDEQLPGRSIFSRTANGTWLVVAETIYVFPL